MVDRLGQSADDDDREQIAAYSGKEYGQSYSNAAHNSVQLADMKPTAIYDPVIIMSAIALGCVANLIMRGGAVPGVTEFLFAGLLAAIGITSVQGWH